MSIIKKDYDTMLPRRDDMTVNEWDDVCNKTSSSKTAKDELIELNTMLEMTRLSEFLDLDSEYKLHRKAEYNMLKYIAVCVEHDPLRGDYYDESNRQLVVDAGRMLNDAGGLDLMRSYSNGWISAFIPKRYRREIDLYWDDIGDWRS